MVVLDQSPQSTPPAPLPEAYLNLTAPTGSLQEEQHYQILAQH